MPKLLRALGNSIRLDILSRLLSGEKCVCEIFDHLDLPQNLVSHHLGVLRKNGLIIARKDGKWVHYSLNPVKFVQLKKFIFFNLNIMSTYTCKCSDCNAVFSINATIREKEEGTGDKFVCPKCRSKNIKQKFSAANFFKNVLKGGKPGGCCGSKNDGCCCK